MVQGNRFNMGTPNIIRPLERITEQKSVHTYHEIPKIRKQVPVCATKVQYYMFIYQYTPVLNIFINL